MFEWWMLILIGVAVGWSLHERKHEILWRFKDIDNQVHMMIVGILGLAVFAMVGMFVGLWLNVKWLCFVSIVCEIVFLAIMAMIYQPWKRWRKVKTK